MNMFTTIEIQQEYIKQNQQLIRDISYWCLEDNDYFHFFYEPKLIIRVKNEKVKRVADFLTSRYFKFKTYSYPNKGKYRQGSAKKDVVMKYLPEFTMMLWMNSKIAVKRDKKDDYNIIEREAHTLINCLGYEWEDEILFYLALAWGRIKCLVKYSNPSPIVYIYGQFLALCFKGLYFLAKGLKY